MGEAVLLGAGHSGCYDVQLFVGDSVLIYRLSAVSSHIDPFLRAQLYSSCLSAWTFPGPREAAMTLAIPKVRAPHLNITLAINSNSREIKYHIQPRTLGLN